MGHIFVLNGPSSSGKTTLARAIQAHIGVACAVLSIDHFYACMHEQAPNNWHLFAALTEAVLATAVSLSNRGFDVVIDTVFERDESLLCTQRALRKRPHSLVAVTCPLEVLETRERARGNRPIGLASSQHKRILHGVDYDFVIDTLAQTPKEGAEQIAVLKTLGAPQTK